MANNDLFSVTENYNTLDNEGLEVLPLITRERTQKFELLLHLIPNLKQHIIVVGVSGIGKTLLLDRLYDINNEAWQCCFVQGNAELSFETIETQLTKAMLRNKHASLANAFHDFKEQNKKIVLIIDDADFLVSGLMMTLIEYATSQSSLKLIFSITPEALNNHRKTDKIVDSCYLLDIPALDKQQCTYFLRYLAAKPRTYGALTIDEKLLEKIYRQSNGVPASIIANFAKLSRKKEDNYTKWILLLAVLVILVVTIHKGKYYFENSVVDNKPVLTIEQNESLPTISTDNTKQIITSQEPQLKTEADIVIPEFKLDIEKNITTSSSVSVETQPVIEKIPESTTIEEEKEVASTPISVKSEKTAEPLTEKIPEPEKIILPAIAFPTVEPANGVKINTLPEKTAIQAIPLSVFPVHQENKQTNSNVVTKAIEIKHNEIIKVEPVKKTEIKIVIKKHIKIKKNKAIKTNAVKKVEIKSVEQKFEKVTEKNNAEIIVTPITQQHYTLQLITLSSQAAVDNFEKKHAYLSKNIKIIKSENQGLERFSLMYGNFINIDKATQTREKLPVEFSNALPRKLNP